MVTFKDDLDQTTGIVQYTYDMYGKRIRRQADLVYDTVFEQDEKFVYDGNNLALVYENGSLTNRYLYADAIDSALAEDDINSGSLLIAGAIGAARQSRRAGIPRRWQVPGVSPIDKRPTPDSPMRISHPWVYVLGNHQGTIRDVVDALMKTFDAWGSKYRRQPREEMTCGASRQYPLPDSNR